MRLLHERGLAALLIAIGAMGAVFAGCGGSITTNTIVKPVVNTTPTPPVWSSAGTFTVSATDAAAPVMTLPSGGGFTGTISTTAALQKYTQATRTLTDAQPQVAPLVVRRTPADVVSGAILVYTGLLFDADVPSSTFSLTMQIPSAAYVPGAQYFLALWDPLRPTLGWQHGFAGPAAVSTSGVTPSLTFTANTAPQFNRYEQYWLAIYMIANGAATPTPAPSISPEVTPTPASQTILNVQTQMAMKYTCSGTPCATGPIPAPTQGPQDYDLVTNIASPSLSGSATQLTLRARDGEAGDVLYFTPSLIEAPLATQFTWDFWFMVDQDLWTTNDRTTGGPKTLDALEFDFNDTMPGTPGYGYNFSSQCYMGDPKFHPGSPEWQIWGDTGSGKNNWVNSGIPCDPPAFKANVWHHIVWKYRIHPDTLTAEYVSLQIDGGTPVTPPLQPTHPVDELKVQAHPTLEVQFQQDARAISPSPPPFTEWVDSVMLTYQ